LRYVVPVLRLGSRRDLEAEDTGEVERDEGAGFLGGRLESAWRREREKKKGRLWRALLAVFGPEFALLTAISIFCITVLK
jgi:hypothetical protein